MTKRHRRSSAPALTVTSRAALIIAVPAEANAEANAEGNGSGHAAGNRVDTAGSSKATGAESRFVDGAPLPTVAESDTAAAWGDLDQTPDDDFIEAVPPHW